MRFSRWFMIILMGAILCAMGFEDVYAQRGGGGGGRGGNSMEKWIQMFLGMKMGIM